VARYASEAKGGFYATPEEEMRLVCARLKTEPNTFVNIIDPCAGEGKALKMVASTLKTQDTSIISYGIELERTRAEMCEDLLDHVINCPYEEARISPIKSFSFMWLNPPYNEKARERTEVIFLKNLTDGQKGFLQEGGLLGYCVPQRTLSSASHLLAARFDDITVYRFTDENFPVYKQIVVFGYRRKDARMGLEAKILREHLQMLSVSDPERLPTLEKKDEITFQIPPSLSKIEKFRSSKLKPEEIAEHLKTSSVFNEALAVIRPPEKKSVTLKPPVLPLKIAHHAICIASGVVGGNMGNHLLTGRTKKVVDEKMIPDEKNDKIVKTERYVTSIRVFTSDGVYNLD